MSKYVRVFYIYGCSSRRVLRNETMFFSKAFLYQQTIFINFFDNSRPHCEFNMFFDTNIPLNYYKLTPSPLGHFTVHFNLKYIKSCDVAKSKVCADKA